jgi:hypothetical protein
MAEHALFLHLMLNEPRLNAKALEIFHQWNHFICVEKMENLNNVIPLLKRLARFKSEVLTRLNAGEYLGSAYPTFVDHILRELLYFADKLGGAKMTAEQEVKFWNTINSEHAAFAASLLDPTEEKLHDKADATSRKIKALPIADIVVALESGLELSDFNKQAYEGILANTIKSVIPETLMYHVVREGLHGNKVLSELLGVESEQVIPPGVCKH